MCLHCRHCCGVTNASALPLPFVRLMGGLFVCAGVVPVQHACTGTTGVVNLFNFQDTAGQERGGTPSRDQTL